MVAAGVGVIISHYPQGRGLCSPVTSGFIELAASCCAMLLLLILNIFTNTKNAFANFTEVYLQSVHSVSSTHSDTTQYGIHKIEQEHFA